jgi:hypothetical protein
MAFQETQASKLFAAEYHFSSGDSPSGILHRRIEAHNSQQAAAKIALELTQGVAVYTLPSEDSEDQGDREDVTEVVVVNASSVRYVRIRVADSVEAARE